MLSGFQELNSVGGYLFSRSSYVRPSVSIERERKKLTVSQELLNEIIAVGSYSLKEISEETNIPVKTLYRIKSGEAKNPIFRIFRKIFGLYCRVCQQKIF